MGFEGNFSPKFSCSLCCLGWLNNNDDPCFFWGEMKFKVDNLEFSGVGNVFLQRKSPSKVFVQKACWLVGFDVCKFGPILYELVG